MGIGALGCVFAGKLAAAGHRVTVVGRPRQVEAIQQGGIQLSGDVAVTCRPRASSCAIPAEEQDVVFVAVKSFDTEQALRQLAPAVGPGTILCMVQNGMGNIELAGRAYPANPVVGSSVLIGAKSVAPARVDVSPFGRVLVGGGKAEAADQVARILAHAGFHAEATANIDGAIWLKTIVIASINPLTVRHSCLNGQLLATAERRAELLRIAGEASLVARACDIDLGTADAVAHVERVAQWTANHKSSMLQSREAGRRLELESTLGALLGRARAAGVACPAMEALLAEVEALQPPAWARAAPAQRL